MEFADGEQRVYKGVLVCNGHHWHKRFPSYPGEFTGEYIHSKDFKDPKQLADKRTVIVKPRVDGQLKAILFTEGQLVKQGDVIAQLTI